MVIIVAAAVAAAGVGAYKGGKAAVAGVKERIEDVKKDRVRNKQKKDDDAREKVYNDEQDRIQSTKTVDQRLSSIKSKIKKTKKKDGPLGRFRKKKLENQRE